jgi:hypothetical protein
MRVNFLSAADGSALSKTFEEIAPGTYKETSYPNVANFLSIERDVESLMDFYATTVACAKEGLCLLKGELDRPLINESRAGHTNSSASTRWLCLDIDYTVTDQTPAEFIDALSPELQGVSYIFQRSASMGIKSSGLDTWRGHFFILLDSPQSPQALKQWLIQRNLVCTSLQTHIGLSASGGALTYPLDVTTCQNDKLLYIAPPNCIGFADPEEQRFELVERDKETAHLDLSAVSAAANQTAAKALITEKRSQSGLEKKKFKTTHQQGTEILTNPDPVTVTGKKEERGFVYLNLNNGDSWGYYFPVNKPDILFNFKGEPCMYMWDVDKDIYNEYSQVASTNSGDSNNAVPFGFLWPNDDAYYRGFANPSTGELIWLQPTGSKGKLRDFFVQYGVQLPKGWAVDEWQLTFDPTTEGKADFSKQVVNTYKKTEYIKNATTLPTTNIPPTIDRVLTSVCVDTKTKEHFINWLASIFQTRQKTNTAWILQGVQGTGKGVLFTHIIAPLIGREYCHEMTMDRLDDDFNAYLTDNIILFIDEAKISDSRNGDRLLNRIKNLVTEPEQHIRGMRRNAVVRENFSNIILASNYNEILHMEVSDRRFNVAPRQEASIQLDYDDIVTIHNELPDFADHLHSHEVDHKAVKQVLLSEARDTLIKISETTVTSFFNAIKTRDLAYFTQYLDNTAKADLEGIRYHDYALVVGRWIASVGTSCNITREELRTCYQFLQSTTISATKFSRMCAHNNLDIKPVRVDGTVTRGITNVDWRLSEEEQEQHQNEAKSNVISFKDKQ